MCQLTGPLSRCADVLHSRESLNAALGVVERKTSYGKEVMWSQDRKTEVTQSLPPGKECLEIELAGSTLLQPGSEHLLASTWFLNSAFQNYEKRFVTLQPPGFWDFVTQPQGRSLSCPGCRPG